MAGSGKVIAIVIACCRQKSLYTKSLICLFDGEVKNLSRRPECPAACSVVSPPSEQLPPEKAQHCPDQYVGDGDDEAEPPPCPLLDVASAEPDRRGRRAVVRQRSVEV